MSREFLKRLQEPALVALYLPGSAWPRSILSTTHIPDAWMGLIERRDGRRRFVPAGDDPRPDEDDLLLLVRNRLITVPLDLHGGKARCGNSVDAVCQLLLKWAARDDDLAALRRSVFFQSEPRERLRSAGGSAPFVPGARELRLDHVAEVVSTSGARAALLQFIREREAAPLVAEDQRDALFEVLSKQLAKFLFDVGATLEQVAKLYFSSPTLAQQESVQRDAEQRVQRIKARELVEQAAVEATHKRLGELTGVLDKLRSAAAAGSDRMQWHELLPSLTPAERGRLLENLWRITPDRRKTRAIVAVAARRVVWIDPARPDAVSHSVEVPEDFGGVRSVSFDASRGWLLVGAASGVWALHAETGDAIARFPAGEAASSPTGSSPAVPPSDAILPSIGGPVAARSGATTAFNSTAIIGDRLYATHSQLGCWSWPCSTGLQRATPPGGNGRSSCHPILQPVNGTPKTVRSVAAAPDGRVIFAADDCVHAFNPADGALAVLAAADDTIHCLAILEHELYVGTADGKLLRLDLRQPDDWFVPYRSNAPIESIVARRWNDLVELVVPAGAQGIVGVYPEQSVVSRLLEGTASIRRVWAADDMLVGLSDRRDRLVLMDSSAPDRRGREVTLARSLGSSIQDACLIVGAVSDSGSA